MIIFLYGQDSYRSKEKLDEIVAHYKEARKTGLNLMYLDAKEADFLDVYHRIKISPMFAETKLIILKNVFSVKQFQEDFSEKLKDLQLLKDVIVIFETEKVDQRLKLYKSLLKEAKSQEFTLLDNRQVKNWAVKEVEKQKGRINDNALDVLVTYVGDEHSDIHKGDALGVGGDKPKPLG